MLLNTLPPDSDQSDIAADSAPCPVRAVEAPLPYLDDMGALLGHQPWTSDARVFVLIVSPGRVAEKNRISDYRLGQIRVGQEGIVLTGKVIIPYYARLLIYGISMAVLRSGFLLVYLVVEVFLRRDRTDILGWSNIEGISYDRRQGRVCIAYHLPERRERSYALGTKMTPTVLADFLKSVEKCAPGIAREAKILSPHPLWISVLIGLAVMLFLGAILYAILYL